ncbi:hypothetical protein GA0074692_6789 [Micromonospora pallida]|uniref:Uncharacterized protein n=1 Tax=Micromonospora pallida TaxID=145854 RepID=A0A1C6TNE3_9ACTN|nr:hypothetical protein [Micromonospora pallida]SCL43254.1 hypothetical protein GA0074692_6789 [Micromonospora pallida]
MTQSPQDVVVELYLGPVLGWVDITDDVRLGSADSGGGITISRGRRGEGQQTEHGSADLVIASPGGRYSPRNPRSVYYGLLGRNTPVRVGVRQLVDAFDDRTVAAGWGPDWTSFGAGGTVAPTDASVSGGMARAYVPATASFRASYYTDMTIVDAEVVVTVDMFISNVVGGAVEPANIMFRVQDLSTYYLCRMEVSAAEVVSVSIHHSTGGTIVAPTPVPGLLFAGQPLKVRASCVADRLAVKVWTRPPAASRPAGRPPPWTPA